MPRILVAIPHFFRHRADGSHGSERRDPGPRVRALASAIALLRANLGTGQVTLDIAERVTKGANENLAHKLDIYVCTTGEDHLIGRLGLPADAFIHHQTRAEPKLLGYECHAMLRDGLSRYDHFALFEDDLFVHDPLYVAKCAWFTSQAGPDAVLQPNRYEIAPGGDPAKAYIDGDIRPHATSAFQNVADRPEVRLHAMGATVTFRRPLNPHSGCFLLSAEQMAHWVRQPWFLDRARDFIGPLESAATLGLMRTFRVYKPAWPQAAFLEIQHAGQAFISLIGSTIRRAPSPTLPHEAGGRKDKIPSSLAGES